MESQPADRHAVSDQRVSEAEFESIFKAVRNWGRWGSESDRGTLNLIQPVHVRAAAVLVRSGRSVSMSIPIDTVASAGNPHPALHYMTTLHDIHVGPGGVRFATDFIGMDFHGESHSHVDALCHVSYKGVLYGGIEATAATSRGATTLDVTHFASGLIGRGVLLDIPRLRGVPWLEPGESVTRAELEAAEVETGVRLGEGDFLVFRTGQHRRRVELGQWDNTYEGVGRAGLHVDTIPWMHERGIAAFLPDGDGEAVPGVVDGVRYPIHALQIVAMGMVCGDSLQLEELAAACEEEQRWEFMIVAAPLRLRGGTGSPINPTAIF